MKKLLRISDSLSLPRDTVTSTIIAYGGKGMGKTVFGSVLAEELAACRLRWSWLDPLGVGYGIRHAADGKNPGVECLLLGGVHGDIPIDPSSGAAVADVVVEESCNVLIDFSRTHSGEMWGVGEKIRFAAAYARRLFQRQGSLVKGHRREPLFQIIDEGARFIPQNVPAGNPGLSECVSAWQQFAEEGRNVALGLLVLTQRSARINKDVAELADAMFAFRTIGPNSLDAVIDWLGTHVPKERARALAEEVRKLPRGNALVVSPGWLETEKVIAIRMRNTFDSSATPKPGESAKIARGSGAKPDLEKILARMVENVERAKADDPKELKKRIVELERQLQRAPKEKTVETPVPIDWKWLSSEVDDAVKALRLRISNATVDSEVIHTNRAGVQASSQFDLARGARNADRAQREVAKTQPATPAQKPKPTNGSSNGSIGGGLRRMMIALAQRPQGLTNRQLGVRAGLSSKSGTFSTYLSRGRSEGWIADDGDRRQITDDGISKLGGFEPLPEGQDLLNYWLTELGGGGKRMLTALADAYPKSLTSEELGEAAQISHKSGTFSTYLSRLRTLELVEGRGELRMSEELAG